MERLTYSNGKEWEIKGADGTPCDEVCENRFLSGCHDCPIQTAFDRLAAYEDTGLTPEEVMALVRDKEDGRLVVLPCKPDDTFFQWKKGDNIPSVSRFEGVAISEDGEITYPMTRWGEVFTLDDFGKTVFLTRAEAEAAMKKREETDGETVR